MGKLFRMRRSKTRHEPKEIFGYYVERHGQVLSVWEVHDAQVKFKFHPVHDLNQVPEFLKTSLPDLTTEQVEKQVDEVIHYLDSVSQSLKKLRPALAYKADDLYTKLNTLLMTYRLSGQTRPDTKD